MCKRCITFTCISQGFW